MFHKGEYIGHFEPAVMDTTDQQETHLNGKTLKTKSTNGAWSLPHITSLSNGFLEPETKQLTAFSDISQHANSFFH